MASFEKAKEKAEAAEQECVRENVDAWAKQVASAWFDLIRIRQRENVRFHQGWAYCNV